MMIPTQNTQTRSQLQPGLAWRPFGDESWSDGGISRVQDGPMSWNGGESAEIAANRANFLDSVGLTWKNAVAVEQVHEAVIHRATRADAGRGMTERSTRIAGADALITNEPGLILTTLHADCAPIYYADREHGVIGLAHAGWRGIIAGLPGEMLERMAAEFGSDPKQVDVAIGPTICTQHYDVDEALAERFARSFGSQVVLRPGGAERPLLDLVAAVTTDLLRAGLSPARIPARPPCTYNHPQFASYRRDGAPVRSMMAWLTML